VCRNAHSENIHTTMDMDTNIHVLVVCLEPDTYLDTHTVHDTDTDTDTDTSNLSYVFADFGE